MANTSDAASAKGLDVRKNALASLMSANPENSRDFMQAVGNAYVAAYPELYNEDADAVVMGILSGILSAETPEEILAEQTGTQSMEDYVGKVINVHSIKLMASDFQDGSPWYVVVDGMDMERMSRDVWTTGSSTIVTQLLALYEKKSLPVSVKVASAPTKGGYTRYYLAGV